MVNLKSMRWLLLVLVLAAGGAAIWRHQLRKQAEGAAAKLARKLHKVEAKDKSEADEDGADKPDPAPPKKAPPATVLGPAAKEHLAEKAFISALRAVFQWRSTQPAQDSETNRKLLEKLSAIPYNDLPVERKTAWQSLLQVWQASGDPAKAADAQLQAKNRQAADMLNEMLRAHGDGDLAL
jgi:hypothetical protein